MSDEEAFAAFVAIRYAESDGQPFCPRCQCAAVYRISTRRKFKCKACEHQFSATSGTIFASRKLPFGTILHAIALFTNCAKGISAVRLSLEAEIQYKTAFVLAHKLREALSSLQAAQRLSGQVEVDGAYFGGYVKPTTRHRDRRDRRRFENKSGKRKCVVVMRERGGKSRPFIGSEHQGASMVPAFVEPGSILYADEAKHYDSLHALFDLKRIDHSKEYARGEVSTNQAESFFSRLRRAEIGTHHHIAGPYLASYAGEMSWREDNPSASCATSRRREVIAMTCSKEEEFGCYERLHSLPAPTRSRRGQYHRASGYL